MCDLGQIDDHQWGGPLPPVPTLQRRRGRDLEVGLGLLPEQRLRAFSAEQLEIVISHWLHSLEARYARVRVFGGSGDKGRDVVGYPDATDRTVWDNYQSKQCAQRLTPADVWR